MTKSQLKLESVDLRDFLEKAVQRYNRQAASKGAYVLLDFVSPGTVSVDADRLGQVFDNLVSIAFNSSLPGKAIEIRARKTPAEWRIHVMYEGPQISITEGHQTFHDKTQITARLAGDPSDAGLSMTRSIVEAHGGRMGVVAEAGHSTDFWFTLPAWNIG